MKTLLKQALCLVLALLLLPVPAKASTFNANDFQMNGSGSSFTVTIGQSNHAVLTAEHEAGRTVQATVACSYDKAYVLLNNAVMPSTLADGEITFDIPGSGDYRIVEDSRFAIANTNMVFGNSLALNFWIRKSDIQTDDCYAVVTKRYADGRSPAVRTVSFEDWQDYSDSYYRISCTDIAAKEMSDPVTVQIFHADGTPASYLYTDSVRSYAMDMLKYYRSGKLTTALVDMLNYGAAAQKHFGYNTADLANNQLTEAQQSHATQSITAENTQIVGKNYFGNSLSLESNIVLNLYFQNVTEDMHAEVSFTDHYGNEKTQRIAYEDFLTNSCNGTTLHGVPVDLLVVADGRKPVTCTLVDKDGTQVGSCVSSVESYVAQMIGGEDPLYEAILKFVDSAYAYFHS